MFCVFFLNDCITFQPTFFCEIKPFTFVYVWLFSSYFGPVMTRATVLFRLLIIWSCLPAAWSHLRAAGFHSVCLGFVTLRQTPLWDLYSTTSRQHGGWLPATKRLPSSGACSVCKTQAGDPLQLEDVNHEEDFLRHNGFSFLSNTKALFFFF